MQELIQHLLNKWNEDHKEAFEKDIEEFGRNDLQLASLFGHVKKNAEFYNLLFERNLLHLIIPYLKIILAPQEQVDNYATYLEAFSLYGIFSWMQEWIRLGMQESAEELETWLRMREI
ncbi:TetR-like C-terminal domain-containing protein [Streptococcus alactolyticus]|uniref:TetR-like C-terminal domain-containing protein n=1 Tax=Streptococcus alactolyticus TaxID=29389 RepID=UPI003D05EC52